MGVGTSILRCCEWGRVRAFLWGTRKLSLKSYPSRIWTTQGRGLHHLGACCLGGCILYFTGHIFAPSWVRVLLVRTRGKAAGAPSSPPQVLTLKEGQMWTVGHPQNRGVSLSQDLGISPGGWVQLCWNWHGPRREPSGVAGLVWIRGVLALLSINVFCQRACVENCWELMKKGTLWLK